MWSVLKWIWNYGQLSAAILFLTAMGGYIAVNVMSDYMK